MNTSHNIIRCYHCEDFLFFIVILICLSLHDLRNVIFQAHHRGMTVPEYVYLFFPFNAHVSRTPWIAPDSEPESTEDVELHKEAFMSLKIVCIHTKVKIR